MAKIRVTPAAQKQQKHPAMQIKLPEVCRFRFVSNPLTITAIQIAEAIGQMHRVAQKDKAA